MSTPTIKTKIALDGEKEYKQAVSNINASLKTLDSEMKLSQARFDQNSESMEALSEKNDILNRKLMTQQEKVAALREAHKNAAQAFGESDTRTMKWQQSLNAAMAEEINLQRKIDKTTAALDSNAENLDKNAESAGKASDATGRFQGAMEAALPEAQGLGDAVNGLTDKLGIQLPDGVTKALNGMQTLSTGTTIAMGALGLLITVIVKITEALYDMTVGAAEAADELLTLSAQTGLTTDALQEFQYASELLDVSVDTLQGSLSKLVRSMDDARDGKNVAAAFEKLDVAVTNADGSLRSAKDVFDDCIDALGKIKNGTERDAIAMDIFGRSAQDLNPLIEAGSDALRDLAAEAHNAGYVLDESALRKLGAVDDAVQRLNLTTETFHKRMSVEFAPYAEKSLQKITEFIDKMGNALVESGAADAFGSILESVVGLLEPLGEIIKTLLPALVPILKTVSVIVAGIADVLYIVGGLMTGNLDLVKRGFKLETLQNTLSNLNKMAGGSGYSYSSLTGSSSGASSYGSPSGAAVNGVTSGGVTYLLDNDKVRIPQTVESVSLADKQEMYEAWLNEHLKKDPVGASFEWWELNAYGGPDTERLRRAAGYNAMGNYNWPGGLTWVGENGPEAAWLPSGSRIYTAQESREMSGGDIFYITISAKDVKEFNDIVALAKNAKRLGRMRA